MALSFSVKWLLPIDSRLLIYRTSFTLCPSEMPRICSWFSSSDNKTSPSTSFSDRKNNLNLLYCLSKKYRIQRNEFKRFRSCV
jgi:hypothetical protein